MKNIQRKNMTRRQLLLTVFAALVLLFLARAIEEENAYKRRSWIPITSLQQPSFTYRKTNYTKNGRKTDRFSILQNAEREDVHMKPFPHLVIREALPQDIYGRVDSNFPPSAVFQQLNRFRTVSSGKQTFGKENFRYDILPQEIRDFLPEPYPSILEYHSSCAFFLEVLDLFEEGIRRFRPEFYRSLNKKSLCSEWSEERNNTSSKDDLLITMRVGINSPSKVVSSNKGPHIDRMSEIFGSLLYVRNGSDKTVGGDFHIHSCKERCAKICNILRNTKQLESPLLKMVKTIKYEANTLVFFINSPLSVHSVGLRHPGEFNRQFLSIYGDVMKISKKYVHDESCCSNCVEGVIGCKFL